MEEGVSFTEKEVSYLNQLPFGTFDESMKRGCVPGIRRCFTKGHVDLEDEQFVEFACVQFVYVLSEEHRREVADDQCWELAVLWTSVESLVKELARDAPPFVCDKCGFTLRLENCSVFFSGVLKCQRCGHTGKRKMSQRLEQVLIKGELALRWLACVCVHSSRIMGFLKCRAVLLLDCLLFCTEKGLKPRLCEAAFVVALQTISGCCGSRHYFKLLQFHELERLPRFVASLTSMAEWMCRLVGDGFLPYQLGELDRWFSHLANSLMRHFDQSILAALASSRPFTTSTFKLLDDLLQPSRDDLVLRPLNLNKVVTDRFPQHRPNASLHVSTVAHFAAVLVCINPGACPALKTSIRPEEIPANLLSLLLNTERPPELVAKVLQIMRDTADWPEFSRCEWCKSRPKNGDGMSYCSGCLVSLFCSEDCQRKAWPSHKHFCKTKIPTTIEDLTQRYILLAEDLNMGSATALFNQVFPDDFQKLGWITHLLNCALPFIGLSPRLSMSQEERKKFRLLLKAKGGDSILLEMMEKKY